MRDEFKDIRAYHTGLLLQLFDWVTILPLLHYIQFKTTKSLRLDYLGERKRIEKDIRSGATFLTNHRDIVMDAAWLSMLVRERYNIRPFIGMGNNLFGKWWIEGLARYNRVFTVKRGGGAHALIENAKHLSAYIQHLRRHGKSIWLAQREGRAKDSDDKTQASVLKMLTMGHEDFFAAIEMLNICPVSISYQYDPCDYLKAQEAQLKRDNPLWRKNKHDDLLSMKTGILGQKGHVVFRLTPSINEEVKQLLAAHPELLTAPRNDQAQAVANIIDRHIYQGYEIFPLDETYIHERMQLVNVPTPDEAFIHDYFVRMYTNTAINHEKSHLSGVL